MGPRPPINSKIQVFLWILLKFYVEQYGFLFEGLRPQSKLLAFNCAILSRGVCSRRRAHLRNALAAESAKARRKAGKRLGAATCCASVRSLTPPLQLFELEGPQRAAFVTSKPENRSRLHISRERLAPTGGEVPRCGDHVVRPGYKRPRAHAVGRSEALHRLPRRLGTFRYQSMLQSR